MSGPNRLERNRVPDDRLVRSRHGQGGAAGDARCFDDLGGELGRPHPAVDLELVGPLGVGVRLGDRPQFARGERLAENYGRAGHGLSGQDDVLRGDIDVIAGRRGRAGEVERDRDRRLRRRVSADDRVARGATREELPRFQRFKTEPAMPSLRDGSEHGWQPLSFVLGDLRWHAFRLRQRAGRATRTKVRG